MVIVPLPAVFVRLAPAKTLTWVWWSLSMVPALTPHQAASEDTDGCCEEVTVSVVSPPKRSKATLVLSTLNWTFGMFCWTGTIRLCLSPITRILDERGVVPV